MLNILPPLIAILLVIIFRQAVVSLLAGIYAGAIFLYDNNPFTGFLRITDSIILNFVENILTDYGFLPHLAIAAISDVLYLILIIFGKKDPNYIIQDE